MGGSKSGSNKRKNVKPDTKEHSKKSKATAPSSRPTKVDNQQQETGRVTRNRAKHLGTSDSAPKPSIEKSEPIVQNKKPNNKKKDDEPKETSEMEHRHDEDHEEHSDGDHDQSGLQNLLRRLGAGFEDIFPHGHGRGGAARIKNILTMMRDEDETQQLAGLTELCEYISISTEDSMITFPTEQVVPLLVNMLGYEHSPDLMLLAARALTFLADVFPPACGAIVRSGAVAAFCARLLTIEYIDLAEQSLQALEKLSHDHREALLKSGALVAVLSYIDFFQTGVQRVAVATAANMCRGVSIDHAEAVATAVPILINLLQYQDAKIVDSSCLALTRIADSYSKNAVQMEMLCSFGLIASIVEMVAVSEGGSISSQLSSSTFYGLVNLLATCSKASPLVAKELLGANVSGTLKTLMQTSPLLSSGTASPGNALRSSDQLENLVTLAANILPGILDANAALLTGRSLAQEEDSDNNNCAVTAYLKEHPEIADKVASDLLPVLLNVYLSSGTVAVKRHCLTAVAKLLYHTPSESLQQLLKELPVSSWVTSLLTSRDNAIVARGLQAAEVLMQKLPKVFSVYFLKEGVVHGMEQLAARCQDDGDTKEAAGGISTRRRASQAPAATKEPEQVQVTTTKDPLETSIATYAKTFLAKYFTDAKGNTLGCDTAGARRLKDLCNKLPDSSVIPSILDMMSATGDDAISTFELLSSGALHSLCLYLSGKDGKSTSDGPCTIEEQMALLERLATFSQYAIPEGSGADPPLTPLISKVLAALGAVDKFTVRMTPINVPAYSSSPYGFYGHRQVSRPSGGPGSGSLTSSLAALANPLKMRLVRASDETGLRDYSSNVVLIEPLASMAQVEDFLWSRVHTSAALADEAGPSNPRPTATRTGGAPAAAAAAATTDAAKPSGSGRPKATSSRPVPQGGTKRMTRAQARAAAEAEVAAMGTAAEGKEDQGDDDDDDGSMSEDEPADLLIQPPGSNEKNEFAPMDEDGEEFYDEEMDEEEGYVEHEDYDEDEDEMDAAAMHVHDMHLGEGEDPSTRRPEEASPMRRSRSYANAASGAAGAGGSGSRTGGSNADESHLAFYINGKRIPSGSTVFQAIQAAVGAGSAASQARSLDMGSRLWGEVHTLTYRSISSARKLDEKEKSNSAGGSKAVVAVPQTCAANTAVAKDDSNELIYSPLYELMPRKSGVLDLDDIPDHVVDALDVLRILEALNRLGPRLVSFLAANKGRPSQAIVPLGHIPREKFTSSKLGPKLSQQLKDVISICGGALPAWCGILASENRFLFPFQVRRRYFYCTALGLPRALLYLQQVHQAEHPDGGADRDTTGLRVGRVQRQKVRISRRRLLDSALKVFELYAGPKNQLEIEFFNEVGTGLGPTLEFYTLLSHELQRKSLGLWRHDANAGASHDDAAKEAIAASDAASTVPTVGPSVGPGPLKGELTVSVSGHDADKLREKDLVSAPYGLFPAPLPPSQRDKNSKLARHFTLLGRVVAKALQDMRLLDLPLSPVFHRLALGRRVDLFDLRSIDPAMGASLERLHAARKAWTARGCKGSVMVDGAAVEDLCLTFVLPGHSDYELRPDGADITVTSANLEEYIAAVVDATLGSGVEMQVHAFRTGFENIFPLQALKPFYVDELEAMLCGIGETWTVEGLAAVIKFDHGYNASSAVIKALLEVLVELDAVDQRRFLRFVTGTPRLPAGGLGALQPRLTVVRKLSTTLSTQMSGVEAALASSVPGSVPGELAPDSLPVGGVRLAIDGDLPSVMTCANYLKLPPYSNKEVLKERLLFAIREGQGSFDLS